MVFAKFSVQRMQQFAERFAVPSHQLCEQQRGYGGVAFGKIQAGADSAAFLAADQDILLEHQLANVFESDGDFVECTFELSGEFVDQLCD